jgi:serine protease Do
MRNDALARVCGWLLAVALVAPAWSQTGPSAGPVESQAIGAAQDGSAQPAARGTNWGTGFVVAPGHVLTAWHVIKGRTAVLVGPVAANRWAAAEVVQVDAVLDLALLRARIDLPPLSLAPSASVPTGLEVSVIGYPQPRFQGLSKKITHGIVNGFRSERQSAQDIGFMQISAEVSKGHSGGPVLAPDGTVIGMVQRKMDAQKVTEQTGDTPVNVSYALRSSQLIRFLQTASVSPSLQNLSLETLLRPYQLFERTQASVVAVLGRQAAASAPASAAEIP